MQIVFLNLADHFLHKSLRQFDTIHKDDISHEVLYQSYSGNHLRLVKFNSLGRFGLVMCA